MARKKAEIFMVYVDMGSHTNAKITGKKKLAKISERSEKKPTVFCPC
jgi:hypothetical protein